MRAHIGIFLALGLSMAAAEPEVELKELPHFPAVEPAAAAATFKVREGFKMELAAHEPNVASPVAMAFDEASRMFVVEMRDYSEHREEKLGRVRMLEDRDGDGVFEKSTVFAEGLAWPTAVICYDGGIFVGATPDILFLRDKNGDGKADERQVVFTGFGKGQERLNVQQLLNSFTWGLDNRIHGATAGNGGTIEQVASRGTEVRLGSRDFSFDPRALTIRPETGGGQHGLSMDDYGRKFICSNSSHMRMTVYEDRYLTGATAISLPPGAIDIAREGPAAEVYRLSPEEPWRTIRTRWRVSGEVQGMIEGGGRASGYFTGATGVTIYRGDAYPPEFSNNAFVGDAGGNLVHRKVLKEAGVGFEASRPADELNREFVASRDTWFRPVQFANAPDGCLYVIDMYREVIEHPWSLPPNLKKHIDLNNGRDRGRIWRIAPNDFKHKRQPDLSKKRTKDLVVLLNHPNGWTRDTAARLIYQRQDKAAIEPLKKLAKAGSPKGRVHAMWSLVGLKNLDEESIKRALQAEPEVVENALRCFENLASGDRNAVDLELLNLTAAEPRVRHQLAWTIAATAPSHRASLLSKIVSADASDPWIRAGVLVAGQPDAMNFFKILLTDVRFLHGKDASEFLTQLAAFLPPTAIDESLEAAGQLKDRTGAFELGAALGKRVKNPEKLKPLIDEAYATLANPDTLAQERLAALHLLRLADPGTAGPVFRDAFAKSRFNEIRVEAFRNLLVNPKTAADFLWIHWGAQPTGVRERALEMLLGRDEGPGLVLEALTKGQITRGDLTAGQSQMLRQSGNPAISRPALEWLGKVDADRAVVIERLRPALEVRGDVRAGEKLFMERCATCHRIAGRGAAVGPDLESVRGNGREFLLVHLVDPNREVNARFVAYSAAMRDRETVTGLLARETEAAVTLKLANAEERTIARSQIVKLSASAQSLMPVGLEDGLDVNAVAGLLDFLQTVKP